MVHVLRFLSLLEASLPLSEIIDAAIHPEEFWLQAFMANHVFPDEPGAFPHIRGAAVQVCQRFMKGYPLTNHVPDDFIDAVARELACGAGLGSDTTPVQSFYAVKPVPRNLSDSRTRRLLHLHLRRETQRSTAPTHGLARITQNRPGCARSGRIDERSGVMKSSGGIVLAAHA